MSASRRRRPAKPKLPKLTYETAVDSEKCWLVIDKFIKTLPSVKPLRAKLTELLNQVRERGGADLAEQIDEVNNELRADLLEHAVLFGFDQGLKEGQRLRAEAIVTDASVVRDPNANDSPKRARRRDHQ